MTRQGKLKLCLVSGKREQRMNPAEYQEEEIIC